MYAKFDELLLHVARRGVFDADLGMTKLNKVLFYADTIAYLRYGEPITGATYIRKPNGPVARCMLASIQSLEEAGRARRLERPVGGYTQKRVMALSEPNWTVLSSRDIAVIDEVMDMLDGKNAQAVSELSHQMVGWQLAEDGEEIPFFTAHLRTDPGPAATQGDLAMVLGRIR